MDQIRELLPKPNIETSEPSNPNESQRDMRVLPNSGGLQTSKMRDENKARYLATVTELIIKSGELANHPPLNDLALQARALAWAEVLFTVVPAEDLKPAFNEAFTGAKTDFAINAQAVKIGYDRLLEKRRQAAQAEAVRESPANAKFSTCDWCFGGGWVSVDRDNFSVPYEVRCVRGVRRCHLCDYWARRNRSMK